MTCEDIYEIISNITSNGEKIKWDALSENRYHLFTRGRTVDFEPQLTFDLEVTNLGNNNFEVICNASSSFGEGYFEEHKVAIENKEVALQVLNDAVSSAVYNGEIDNILGGDVVKEDKDIIKPDYSGNQSGSINISESASSASELKATLEDFNIEFLKNDLMVFGNDINLKPVNFNDKELVARGYVSAPAGDFDLEVNIEKLNEHDFDISVFVESTLGAGEYSGTFEEVSQDEIRQILKICLRRCFKSSGELRRLLESKMKESKYTPYKNQFLKSRIIKESFEHEPSYVRKIGEDEFNRRVQLVKDIFDEIQLNKLNHDIDFGNKITVDDSQAGIIQIDDASDFDLPPKEIVKQIKKIVNSISKGELTDDDGDLDVEYDDSDDTIMIWYRY